jgi:hypothetical protein
MHADFQLIKIILIDALQQSEGIYLKRLEVQNICKLVGPEFFSEMIAVKSF